MAVNLIENSDTWAYDIDKDIREIGEAYNDSAINNSIENILMTSRGERIFLPNFGSPLPLLVFETLNETNGERVVDEIVRAIKDWEDRVTIIEEQVELNIFIEQNSMVLILPYIIKRTGLRGTFLRKIIL